MEIFLIKVFQNIHNFLLLSSVFKFSLLFLEFVYFFFLIRSFDLMDPKLWKFFYKSFPKYS